MAFVATQNAPPKKHTAYLPNVVLVAGNNTLTHGLNLIAPFACVIEAEDAATGEVVSFKRVTRAQNSVVVKSATAQTINITFVAVE